MEIAAEKEEATISSCFWIPFEFGNTSKITNSMHIAGSGIERNSAVWNPPTELSVGIPEPKIGPPIHRECQLVSRIGFPAVRDQLPRPAAQTPESPAALRR
jgi:hypothetical protein